MESQITTWELLWVFFFSLSVSSMEKQEIILLYQYTFYNLDSMNETVAHKLDLYLSKDF